MSLWDGALGHRAFSRLLLVPRLEAATGRRGPVTGVEVSVGHLAGLEASHAAGAAAHAGLHAAGLGRGGGHGAAAGGQVVTAVRRQIGGGEEHEPGIAQRLAAVHRGIAADDGERAALGQRAAAAAAAETAHTAEAERHAGLLRAELHVHAAAAARRQYGAAADADSPVRIQRLVIGAVGRPYGDAAAADVQAAVGVEPVPAAGIGHDGAAADVHGEVVPAQVAVGGVQAVVRGVDGDITGADIQSRALDALIARADDDGGAVGARRAHVQRQVAVQGVVPGGDGDGAALHVQQLLGVHRVVDRRVDGQRQLADGQGRLALLGGGGPGLDAVLTLGVDGQASGAAQHHPAAVLALDDRVLCVFVVGILAVVVLLAVGQHVGAARRGVDGHLRGLIAGDGRGVGAGQVQPVQHQRDADGALLHGDGAVAAGAGKDVGARAVDGHGGALHGVAGVVPIGRGHAAVGERQGGGSLQGHLRADRLHRVRICIGIGGASLSRGVAGRQAQRQRRGTHQRDEFLFHVK